MTPFTLSSLRIWKPIVRKTRGSLAHIQVLTKCIYLWFQGIKYIKLPWKEFSRLSLVHKQWSLAGSIEIVLHSYTLALCFPLNFWDYTTTRLKLCLAIRITHNNNIPQVLCPVGIFHGARWFNSLQFSVPLAWWWVHAGIWADKRLETWIGIYIPCAWSSCFQSMNMPQSCISQVLYGHIHVTCLWNTEKIWIPDGT